MNEAAGSLTASLLQKCKSITCLYKARQLHALIFASSPPHSFHLPYLHNNILSMYAACGAPLQARKVFDHMPLTNFISYNSIISAFARHPLSPSYPFHLFSQMRFRCMEPNAATYISLLRLASHIRDWFLGVALHCLLAKSGILFDVHVQTALLGFYSNLGNLNSADRVFGDVLLKDAYSWNCIISGYVKNGKMRQGLCRFRAMLASGVAPTEFSYSVVLNACARSSDYAFGRLAHAHIFLTGVLVDLPLQNALLDMYSSCGDSHSASQVFHGIQNPDLVSWNSMLAGYAECGEGEKALDVFVQMQIWAAHTPDEYTFAAVISAIRDYPASLYGELLHAKVIVAGWDKSVYVGSSLISMYFRTDKLESAESVFHSIPKQDVVLWTDMISGYSKASDGENAVKFFCNMWRGGHIIDDFALSSVLSACADLASLKQGEMFHCLAIKAGYDSEMSVCGSLIDAYAKTGSLQAAESIFANVINPDLKCYNLMIGGYGHHGRGEEAMKLFNEISVRGLELDAVTYISGLSACSHSGWVSRGKYLWKCMKEKGVSPGVKHYSCMVSLLCRAGLLEEAVEIIEESGFGGNHLELWRSVLSSSVSSKNLSMGVDAAKKILTVDAHDSATYTLVSNLYAAVGRWEGVLEVRKKIRGLMLEKDPGVSWIEEMGKTEVFSSGDESHPMIEVVKAQLQLLQGDMMVHQDMFWV